MLTTNGNEVLEFKLNYKVTKKVKHGFLGLKSREEDFVILNDGETALFVIYEVGTEL